MFCVTRNRSGSVQCLCQRQTCTQTGDTRCCATSSKLTRMLLFWLLELFHLKEGTSGLFLQICVQVCSFNSSGGLSHLECFGQLLSALSPWGEVKSQYRDTSHGLFCTLANLPEHWPAPRSLNEPF